MCRGLAGIPLPAWRRRTPGERALATNRKAFFHYEVLERAEAGIVLVGTEVKSIRDGGLDFRDAYVDPRGGELLPGRLSDRRPTATAT